MQGGGKLRGIVALAMAAAFCLWIAGSALIACPFLQAELNAARHPCCPRTGPAPHCPLSQTLQDCPFYVTESKIGITEAIQHADPAHAVSPMVVPIPAAAPDPGEAAVELIRDASGLHLRIRVLLI